MDSENDAPAGKDQGTVRHAPNGTGRQPIFAASSTIGGAVAADRRMLAVYALVVSWICIIVYLWVRFQGVAFGLAAVVALIHDIFVMLGAVAISVYIAPYLGFLLIEPVKMNLSIVAAFLTIVGYSVNDTIVVFDRIREVRGKDPNADPQNGQRQHEPDAEPDVADLVHRAVGGVRVVLRRRQRDARVRLRVGGGRGYGHVQFDLRGRPDLALAGRQAQAHRIELVHRALRVPRLACPTVFAALLNKPAAAPDPSNHA